METLQGFSLSPRSWSECENFFRRVENLHVKETCFSQTCLPSLTSPQSQRPSSECDDLSRRKLEHIEEPQEVQSLERPLTDHECINKIRRVYMREPSPRCHLLAKLKSEKPVESETTKAMYRWNTSGFAAPILKDSLEFIRPAYFDKTEPSPRCHLLPKLKSEKPVESDTTNALDYFLTRFRGKPILKSEDPFEKGKKEIIDVGFTKLPKISRSSTGLSNAPRTYEYIGWGERDRWSKSGFSTPIHDSLELMRPAYVDKTGCKQLQRHLIPTETEKPSTTFGRKCDPKPMFGKITEAAPKLSTHSLYFKMKNFPRFQYVYNLVRDCKYRIEKFRKRKVKSDEMFENVIIKIVIVGSFIDDDLHLLTKSAEKKKMQKGKHIWKVQPHVCFENDFFSESNIKKFNLESTRHKILIKSDTFWNKRDKADDSIIIVERNKEQIKETITSCLEEPLHLLLQELLEVLKIEGSSRLASGLIAETEAIQKQMKSCHFKDKDVSSNVLPSASASSIVPDNIIDFLFRKPDVHSFGIWRNSSFKVFVKKTDEDKLRDELIKVNPNFFEMFNLEIEKRKFEDKQTDAMQGDVILAEIQDGGGNYRKGTLGGFVITTDEERKLYALTCNHIFPEKGKQAFTGNVEEIGTCSFTTRENTCDFAAIEIKKSFSENCDEAFHKEDSGKTNAHVFSKNLKDIGIVHKIGATTKVTTGTIVSSEYYDKLTDNKSREHIFLVQGTQGNFSEEGDSGSLVFTRSKNARQTSVDVLGMVFGNKVTVCGDDEEQENQVENKPEESNGSKNNENELNNKKVDGKESSNTSTFQEGDFAASSSEVPDDISCCFRIHTALQLFEKNQGKEVKFRDDLSPSTSLSSDSDDTNRDEP